MQKWMLRIIVVIFTWSSKVTNCHGSNSNSKNITVIQFDTVRLDCYSGYDESADWYFHSRFGDTDPIYSSGYLQPQQELKYSITPGSGFYNLTIFNVSFEDIGRYECREGWGVGGRPRHNFELNVTDVDECTTWNACNVNANCTNTVGSFYCTCKSGFIGDGFECEDVNECYAAPCGANAICTNLPGSYLCTCLLNDHIYLKFLNGCTVNYEMHVPMGESMQLRCQTFPNAPIMWLFMATDVSSGVQLYPNNEIVDTFRNITKSLMKPDDGDYSLTLREVEPAQTGYYVCVNQKDETKRGYFLNVSVADEERRNLSSDELRRRRDIAIITGTCIGVGATLLGLVTFYVWIKVGKRRLEHAIVTEGDEAAVVFNTTPCEDSSNIRSRSTASGNILQVIVAASEGREGDVTGLTVLGDELFLLRKWCNGLIEVYNATNFTFERNIKVESDGCYCGLTSCDSNSCLYVSYYCSGGFIARVELTGNDQVVEWQVKDDYEPQGLSVNSQFNLIVAAGSWSQMTHKVIEYTTRGELVREILLPDDFKWPQHAILLNSRELLVSYSHGDNSLHRVCVVDPNNGRVLLSYGNKRGSETGQLHEPRHLAVDRNGFIFVADRDNNRIVVLDRTLKWSRDLQLDDSLKRPWSLHLEERRYMLLVGEESGDETRVFSVTL